MAPRLLGKLLVHRTSGGVLAGRIVEVEAYLGPHHSTPDPAAHAHRGPTPRNQVLFGPAGHAYVYAIYGQYFCMNISCEAEGQAGSVLLRALEPVAGLEQMARNRGLKTECEAAEGCEDDLSLLRQKQKRRKAGALGELTSGPSRLCQAMSITRSTHNGLDLLNARSPLQVREDGFAVRRVLLTPRIGIRHAADLPLRFCLPDHGCVSGDRKIRGSILDLR